MTTTIVAFDCGAGIVAEPGQTVDEVVADHEQFCGLCPDRRTEHEKRLDELGQKNWEARVDAALKGAKESA